MILNLQDTKVELLNDHAVFVHNESALILSDVHLGKAATFRASGIAIPDGDDVRDLKRISKLIEKTSAKKLIIAGDLLHSPSGVNSALLNRIESWLKLCRVDVTLVIGNHDKRSLNNSLTSWIKTKPSLTLGALEIIHDPADHVDKTFCICGHIHPIIKIKDSQRTSLRSPCFILSSKSLILPSFGTFTGGQIIIPQKNDRVFIPHTKVIEIPKQYWVNS